MNTVALKLAALAAGLTLAMGAHAMGGMHGKGHGHEAEGKSHCPMHKSGGHEHGKGEHKGEHKGCAEGQGSKEACMRQPAGK